MKTYKYILIALLLTQTRTHLFGQQDEQNSMYMFNPLHYNPAYAGSRGGMNLIAVFRAQWIGVDGAPMTQFLSAHTPVAYQNMAVGFNLCNDKVGARNRTTFYGNYSYTLKSSDEKHHLNFGVSAGGDMMSVDYSKLKAKDPNETDYLASFARTTFNTGAGIYYYTKKAYLGFSVPRLLETKLRNKMVNVELSNSYVRRHFFFTAGKVFPLNSITDLKTSLLLKMTPNAPITLDLNANVFFHKTWWVGAMYRYNESFGVNVAFQLKESLMFGYSFDYPINGLSTISKLGSHEIMLSYDINRKNQPYGSPRYF